MFELTAGYFVWVQITNSFDCSCIIIETFLFEFAFWSQSCNQLFQTAKKYFVPFCDPKEWDDLSE